MARARLPAHEVGGRLVRPGFEQQHFGAGVGELARDDPAAGARPDHDHVEVLTHSATPRYDQSLSSRAASGGAKSISSQAPGPGAPGATKSL